MRSFNRAADWLQFVTRKLLLVGLFHYVDDFAAIDQATWARSGYQSFTSMSLSSDFRMEMKKASPPSRRQKLLGVIFPFDDQGLTISPCRDRLSKIKNLINQALQDDRLTPLEAQRLADKLVFLQTTAFGQVGKSAMQSIYSRSAASDDGQHHLNTGLRSSLTVLGTCLCCLKPRWIPVTIDAPQTVIYTDAYFALGGTKFKPRASNIRIQLTPYHSGNPPMAGDWLAILSIKPGMHMAASRAPWFASIVRGRLSYIFWRQLCRFWH